MADTDQSESAKLREALCTWLDGENARPDVAVPLMMELAAVMTVRVAKSWFAASEGVDALASHLRTYARQAWAAEYERP